MNNLPVVRSPWRILILLLGFTFLIGCGTALHNPSWQATMGDIVTRDELATAVSLNSIGSGCRRLFGPAKVDFSGQTLCHITFGSQRRKVQIQRVLKIDLCLKKRP